MARKKNNSLHNAYIATVGAVVFVGVLMFIFALANWPAIKSEFNYFVYSNTKPSPNPSTSPTPTPITEAPHIIIDKIQVDAPITWDVSAEATLDALNHGVSHLGGTARPGELGNTFITGHSSDYVWKNNPYAATFALVPKLAYGDRVIIRENGKSYIYKVMQTRIVNPDQVEVVKPTTTPVLTLMTCYPVGTTRQRFIVHAALISSPDTPRAATHNGTTVVPEIKFR